MNADEIHALRGELEHAGARLQQRRTVEILDALGQVLELWRDPGSPVRDTLARELPKATGFSEAVVREGAERAFAGWDRRALFELVAREFGDVAALDAGARQRVRGFPSTSLLLAGCLPSPTLHALLMPLVLRSPVLVKPASRDLLTPRLVLRSLAMIDSELADCVALAPVARDGPGGFAAFLAAPCVVAFGADEAMQAVTAGTRPWQRVVLHGHRVSIAVLGDEALTADALPRTAEALALDIALWDQQGCLSPIAVYAVGHGAARAERLAAALGEALAHCETRLPRGDIDDRAAVAWAAERDGAVLRASADARVSLHAGPTWAVVNEADAVPRPAPLHRFVRVHPVPDPGGLASALEPIARHLAAVGIAGFSAGERARLDETLAGLGASRLCPPGTLQAPPLGWCHDGRAVLAPLARRTDREPGG